jgi:UDP-3-O-[3-hydroxymyristoyl] glucosamine N-acyltransferase
VGTPALEDEAGRAGETVRMKSLTIEQIAALAGAEVAAEKPGKLQLRNPAAITRVSGLENATANALVFAQDEAALNSAMATKAGAILAPKSLQGGAAAKDARVVWVEAPKYAFAVCAKALVADAGVGIHASASVDETARWGLRLRVGAGAVIEGDVSMGDDVMIAAGAKILRGTELGSRVVVQAGAVLGSTGFGYVRNRGTGEYLLFPQIGKLVVEDDVEIGANTTIDRGALGETRIGKGTKIDNLVQIGHNCTIGKNVVIASQVGISGSCVIEDGVILAGQVGLGDHVTIGKGVVLGGQGGVYPGKTLKGENEMFAGTPAEPVREFLKTMARVRRLK